MFEFVGTGSFLVYYSHYGNTGEELGGFYGIGIACRGFAECGMLLQFILVGKGWTIVRRKISAQGRVKIATYITTYFVMYWACQASYCVPSGLRTTLLPCTSRGGEALL